LFMHQFYQTPALAFVWIDALEVTQYDHQDLGGKFL
jgi:hypothetical protein